jgi:hypothetical protein
MSANLLRRAIELYREGQKEEANRLLKAVVRQEPENQIAWNWYIETINDPQERIHALEEYLLINPDSRQALRTLSALRQQIGPTQAVAEPPKLVAESQTELPQTITSTPALQPDVKPIRKGTTTPEAVPATQSSLKLSNASIIAILSVLLLAALFIYTSSMQQDQRALQRHYETLQTSYASLQTDNQVTVQENIELKNRLDGLWLDYDYLLNIYNDLAQAYTDLEGRSNIHSQMYIELEAKYNTLLQDYDALQGKFSSLKSNGNALSGK